MSRWWCDPQVKATASSPTTAMCSQSCSLYVCAIVFVARLASRGMLSLVWVGGLVASQTMAIPDDAYRVGASAKDTEV